MGYGEKGFLFKRCDDLKECREICLVLKAYLVSLWGKDCVNVCLWGKDCGLWQSRQAGFEGLFFFYFFSIFFF